MTLPTGALLSVLATASWGDLISLLVRVTLITTIGAGVCALLRNASAARRHLAAMATLTVLIGLPVAWALLPTVSLPILPAKAQSGQKIENAMPQAATEGNPSVVLTEANAGSVSVISTSAGSSVTGSRILDLAILIALIGTIVLLLQIFLSIAAASYTVRRARRIKNAQLRSDLDTARARLGVSRAVDLRESTSVNVPVVWGFFRPVLLLPVGARAWTREQLRVVFLHEVAHVARHDGVGLLLARVATSLFWFHPMVWVLARIARRECERCCDDLVIAAGERPTDYAERLLTIVRTLTRPDPLARVAPALAQRSNLESRLVSILRPDQRRGAISRSGLMATIGTAAFLLIATAVIHVVEADAVGQLVDPKTELAGLEDHGFVVGEVQNPMPTEPLSADEAKKGEHWFRAGEKAFDEGSYVKAASSYLSSAARGNRFPESLYRAAGALAKAGSNEDAMRTLEAAVQAGFDGTCIASDPNFEGLRGDPRFAELLNPQPAPAAPAVPIVVAPAYQVIVGTANKKLADVFNQSGITLMRAGQFERAIEAFQEEVRETGSSNAMYNMACAYSLKGDKRRAFDALQQAIENGFDNSQHMMQDEDLRLIQGDPHFYQLVRLSKDLQLFGGGNWGNGIRDEDDWRKSLSRFERVTREHPKIGRAWANLGFARLESGDPQGGASAYQRALELGYQGPTVMYNLACCAARAGDVNKAFTWLDRAEKAGFEIGEHVGTDSDLDAIRDDPRYGDLLERWDQKMAKEHREEHKDHEVEKTY